MKVWNVYIIGDIDKSKHRVTTKLILNNLTQHIEKNHASQDKI